MWMFILQSPEMVWLFAARERRFLTAPYDTISTDSSLLRQKKSVCSKVHFKLCQTIKKT
jgi:hypothetical protein